MPPPHDYLPDATRIIGALTELHALARAFSDSSTATEFGITLQVAFLANAAFEELCATSSARTLILR